MSSEHPNEEHPPDGAEGKSNAGADKPPFGSLPSQSGAEANPTPACHRAPEKCNKPTTEAERFRNFAKAIIAVPKKDVDRREAAWRKRKAAAKAAKA